MTTLTDFEAIDLIVTAMQDINIGIKASEIVVRTAPGLNDYPSEMDPAYLPCSIVIPGEGSTVSYGNDKRTTRNFVIKVFVAPTSLNIPGLAIKQSYILLQAFLQTWLGRISSTVDNTTLDSGTDSGVRVELVPFQQQPPVDTGVISDLVWTDEDVNFWGFEITLGVYVRWPITC